MTAQDGVLRPFENFASRAVHATLRGQYERNMRSLKLMYVFEPDHARAAIFSHHLYGPLDNGELEEGEGGLGEGWEDGDVLL